MRFFLLSAFLLLPVALALTQPRGEMPAKFLGSWSVDHSENFDEYLEVGAI
jgi:hypothetical protein